MIPDFGPEAEAAVIEAASQFPETFRLRAYGAETFRIHAGISYVSAGRVVLYTQRLAAGDEWLDFAKGSPAELRAQVVPIER